MATRKKAGRGSGAASRKRSKAAEPDENGFRKQLDRSLIALPLLEQMEEMSARTRVPVVIDLNFNHYRGLAGAKIQACSALAAVLGKNSANVAFDEPTPSPLRLAEVLELLPTNKVDHFKTRLCPQYVFAELTRLQIQNLLKADQRHASEAATQSLSDESKSDYARDAKRPQAHDVADQGDEDEPPPLYRCRAIYKIWPDFPAEPFLQQTVSTVKADAARISFSASGNNVVWAVIDSGIDSRHAHFRRHRNLDLPEPLRHADFTANDEAGRFPREPTDDFGHGTHVAGILAGEVAASSEVVPEPLTAFARERNEQGEERYENWRIERISGVAPECKLLSLKVLDDRGRGNRRASNILAALAYVNELNEHGRRIRVHGVNLSVGYEFEADWFGCGQSPLCVEVDRLVRSGVVVVAAAGNTGYGAIAPSAGGPNMAGLALTINDPGNAALAITVGSTHRFMPEQYGVSYFSSKGPTGDGRAKPDLVAPGENVLSCAAGRKKAEVEGQLAKQLGKPVDELTPEERCAYREESGTSMAAPHVSGVIADFLSIRPGYIGRPGRVKEIFLSTATDLGRERYFQGSGLVDLMRAIQSV